MANVENPDEIDIASDVDDDHQMEEGDVGEDGEAGGENEVDSELPVQSGEDNLMMSEDAGMESLQQTPSETNDTSVVEPIMESGSTAPPKAEVVNGGTSNGIHPRATSVAAGEKQHANYTKFLALDKCLPSADFLQVWGSFFFAIPDSRRFFRVLMVLL